MKYVRFKTKLWTPIKMSFFYAVLQYAKASVRMVRDFPKCLVGAVS